MRLLSLPSALTSVGGLAVLASLSCANADGENIPLGSRDGATDAPRGDVTITYIDTGTPHDTGIDTTMGMDQFVAPPHDAGHDTSMMMMGGMDAGFDGGLVFFGNPGSSCTTLGAKQAQSCGLCGMQTSTCIVRPDGGVPFDAGVDAPPPIDAGVDATLDAGAPVDAGGTDAADAAPHDAGHDVAVAVDAGHDAGVHDAAAHDAASDGGPDLVWGEWGTCTGQLSPDAGCLPGTQKNVVCGACGTQTFVCEPDCEYGATACTGQIDGGCIPGTVDFTPSAACSAVDGGVDGGDGGFGFGGTQQVCTSTCTWDASTACVTPPTTLTVSTTTGGKLDTFVDFTAANERPLVEEGFGATLCTTAGGTNDPIGYVTLVNPSTSTTATVSVWSSQVAGQPIIDTAVGEYPAIPTSTASLKACTIVPTDTCFDTSDPTSCLSTYGGLMIGDFSPVVIPAGGSVVIFLQDQNNDTADLGIVQLTVRTESFP